MARLEVWPPREGAQRAGEAFGAPRVTAHIIALG
jgi:hypothetical protein